MNEGRNQESLIRPSGHIALQYLLFQDLTCPGCPGPSSGHCGLSRFSASSSAPKALACADKAVRQLPRAWTRQAGQDVRDWGRPATVVTVVLR